MKVAVYVWDVEGRPGGDDELSWGEEIIFDVDCKDPITDWNGIEKDENQAKFKEALEKLMKSYIFAPGDKIEFKIVNKEEEE